MAFNVNTAHGGRGVRVVHDTHDTNKYPGIGTSEGFARPLIFGETMFAHSLEMPAGLVVGEHEEPEESMVYTVRGRWVLAVNGEEHLMQPGSLHWIKEGASAGCRVPFEEPALVMAFMRVKSRNGSTPIVSLALSRKNSS